MLLNKNSQWSKIGTFISGDAQQPKWNTTVSLFTHQQGMHSLGSWIWAPSTFSMDPHVQNVTFG